MFDFVVACDNGHRWAVSMKDLLEELNCPECNQQCNIAISGHGKAYRAALNVIMETTRPAEEKN